MSQTSSGISSTTGKIAVVVLNYNNAPDTIECVKSLAAHEGQSCLIIIVDNSSTDNSVEEIRRGLAGIDHHLIISPDNRGYAAGNNLGIRYAVSRDCDFVCILNNDTLLTTNSVSQLATYLDQDPGCSVAGPAILEYSNPGIVQSAGANINLLTGSVAPLYEGASSSSLPSESYTCGYIGGACMMFRSSDLERLHHLPENYFLFFEETEWCYQASRHVAPVKCVPSISILHKGSASISKNNVNKSDLIIKNRVLFERRNANPIEFLVFALRFLVVSTLAIAIHGKSSLKRFGLFSQALREAKEGKILPHAPR